MSSCVQICSQRQEILLSTFLIIFLQNYAVHINYIVVHLSSLNDRLISIHFYFSYGNLEEKIREEFDL